MHATDSTRYLAWALGKYFGLGRTTSEPANESEE